MAGGITIEFDDARFQAALKRLEDAAVRPEPLLRALGTALVDQTVRRFAAQKAPDGTPWAGLNAAYAALRKEGPILIQSGALRGSITFRTTAASVQVGSAMIYAGVHQSGAVIEPRTAKALRFPLMEGGKKVIVTVRRVRIPARPYLGLNADDEAELIEVAEAVIGKLIG